MRQVSIKGFTSDVSPHSRPAICVYGEEFAGTTRFGTTAPCGEGVIGWIALDVNSKVVLEARCKKDPNIRVLVNSDELISTPDSIKLMSLEDVDATKKIYTAAFQKLTNLVTSLASSPDVESIVIDRASQVFDIVLMSHFGRRNQIETFQRGPANQDMIDFIRAMSTKNLVLCCKAADIWKDTGEIDKKTGRMKQAPSGKQKPDGFSRIQQFVTATIELTDNKKKFAGDMDEDDERAEMLKQKYRCKCITTKNNTLLEGQDLGEWGVCGEGITWENVLAVLGIE